MIVIRNVFRCKPGKAKKLVEKLKAATAVMEDEGIVRRSRVLTDLSSTFWTVVLETEAESIGAWEKAFAGYGESSAVRQAMEGYMELVDGGHREIWNIE